MKSKIITRIIIVCLVLLFIALIACCVLYFATDSLKSSKQVFDNYFAQKAEDISNFIDLSDEQAYFNLIQKNNYNDNSKINIKYTNSQKNDEVFNITSIGATDNTASKSYRKVNIKYGDNVDVLNVDFLKENNMYGVLFSDVVKKYIYADTTNLNTLLQTLDIDRKPFDDNMEKYQIKDVLALLVDKKQDVKNVLINLKQNVNKKQYETHDEKVITLSKGESITTKAYTVKLTSSQTRKLTLDLLKAIGDESKVEKLSQKENFPEVEITMYVSENGVGRITIFFDNKEYQIDFYNNELDIKYTNSQNEMQTVNVNLRRTEQGKIIEYEDTNNNKLQTQINIVNGETQSEGAMSLKLQTTNISQLDINIQQNLELLQSVEISQSLENQENIMVNELNTEQLTSTINGLIDRINVKIEPIQKNTNSQILKMFIEENKKIEEKYENLKKQRENEFNNQFLPYEGQNVDKNILFNLLDLVGKNMTIYQTKTEDKDKLSVRIKIEEGTENKEKIEEIKKFLEKANGTFNISFKYNSDGKLNIILIEPYIENQNQ